MANQKDIKLIEEAREKYGSVSKMIAIVDNEVSRLVEYGGYRGRDGADTLAVALYKIDSKFHTLYRQYCFSFPRP